MSNKRKDGSQHVHNWVLVRREVKKGVTYEFYECVNPGCPNPNRMEIH